MTKCERSDNPFRDRLRYTEAREKMDEAERAIHDYMLVGGNFGMPLEEVVKRLCSMTTRLLKKSLVLAEARKETA